MSSSGIILLVTSDPGKRGRKYFISVNHAEKILNGTLQGLLIANFIARFCFEIGLIGKKYPIKPSVMSLI